MIERGEMVVILQNSGPWDNKDFYGRVGEVSHTDYGTVAVSVDSTIVFCDPGNLIKLSAVGRMYEALQGMVNDYTAAFLADPVDFIEDAMNEARAVLDAAKVAE
ncbi:hypothetical protein KC887_07745 [Candidatus Kaiserbacteria bacterium]|nr:hypothetical protein [Candidatus Kaiserbacteria bacterium]